MSHSKPRIRYPARKRYRALCRWCMGAYATATLTNGAGLFECPRCGARFDLDGHIKAQGRGAKRYGVGYHPDP